MITFPNAKINLGLNVVAKRPDGYHDLETVFYPINLSDVLEVNERKSGDESYTLRVSGHLANGDAPEDNLVSKAYLLLKKDFPDLPSVDMRLCKHIPVGAGLGGGSSDAAHTLKLLNELFSLQLDERKLEGYAAQLGADCAFFIRNRAVLATGIGNVFEPLELSLAGCFFVLVKPDLSVSTREAYAHVVPRRSAYSLREIIHQPVETWKDRMKNDFEDSVFKQYPEIAVLKDRLYDLGAIYASMSGSGAAVYGIFNEAVVQVEAKFDGCFCQQGRLE